MIKLAIILTPFILFDFNVTVPEVAGTDLPYNISNSSLTPLKNRIDTTFQKLLSKKLRTNSYWNKLINNKKMCVGVVDIRNPNNVRYARVNGGVMMYAASLPKIAILLA